MRAGLRGLSSSHNSSLSTARGVVMKTNTSSSEATRLHQRALVVDFHAHPSLKTYLFRRKLQKRYRPRGLFWPFTLRTNLPSLSDGGVNAVVSAIYLPERALLSDCFPLRILQFLSPNRWKRLMDDDRLQRTLDMLDDLEEAVSKTTPVDGVRLEVARSRSELDTITARGDIAFIHAVEGAHSLNGDPANVGVLFERGVSTITLVHFYPNGVAFPVDGIPPSMKRLGCFRTPVDLTKGLDTLGPPVIEEMVRLGIIVDMTHCTFPARQEVIEIVDNRRPIIMSHVGAATLRDDPMNPTDREIQAIANSGGMVGVIAMNHWLGDRDEGDGIDLMVATIERIRQAGGIETAAIGTDFDGFTDPPDDLTDHSHLPRLSEALFAAGFSAADLEKILGGNARRVLEAGWGR